MLLVSVRKKSPNVDVIASHKIRPAVSVAATGMVASNRLSVRWEHES